MTSAHHKLLTFATVLTMVLAIDALAMAGTALAGVSRGAGVSCASSETGFDAVVVVADSGKTAAVAAEVRAAGGRVCDHFGRLLDARIPARSARELRGDSDVTAVRPSSRPHALGFDEGVGTTNAPAWHARKLSGAGVAVAIIDLGFAGIDAAQAAGPVPASAERVAFRSPRQRFVSEKHGT